MAETNSAMQEIRLPQGAIRYRELGEGEPIVFVHGYLVDGRLWSQTAEHLSATHRCILPDWPMGAHRVADECRRGPLSPGDREPDRRLPRGDGAERHDDRRQRQRRGDVAGARDAPPGARRPVGADQLRHARELPAIGLQADAAPGQAAGRDDRDVAAVPPGTHSPGGVRAIREHEDPSRADRQLDGALAAGRWGQARYGQGHRRIEQALHAGGRRATPPSSTGQRCSPGRPRTASSSSPTRSAWRRRSPTQGSRPSPTRRPSCRSTSQSAWRS